MKQPNRIIQLNKEIRANAATIVIAAVLLYVVISVVSSLSKESVTIYQVSKGDVSNDVPAFFSYPVPQRKEGSCAGKTAFSAIPAPLLPTSPHAGDMS